MPVKAAQVLTCISGGAWFPCWASLAVLAVWEMGVGAGLSILGVGMTWGKRHPVWTLFCRDSVPPHRDPRAPVFPCSVSEPVCCCLAGSEDQAVRVLSREQGTTSGRSQNPKGVMMGSLSPKAREGPGSTTPKEASYLLSLRTSVFGVNKCFSLIQLVSVLYRSLLRLMPKGREAGRPTAVPRLVRELQVWFQGSLKPTHRERADSGASLQQDARRWVCDHWAQEARVPCT